MHGCLYHRPSCLLETTPRISSICPHNPVAPKVDVFASCARPRATSQVQRLVSLSNCLFNKARPNNTNSSFSRIDPKRTSQVRARVSCLPVCLSVCYFRVCELQFGFSLYVYPCCVMVAPVEPCQLIFDNASPPVSGGAAAAVAVLLIMAGGLFKSESVCLSVSLFEHKIYRPLQCDLPPAARSAAVEPPVCWAQYASERAARAAGPSPLA